MQHYDVIVLGAGAAGLMCAMRAGQRGRRTLVLEQADKVGAKILISGGGRCNFTNRGTVPDRFYSQNPHFCIAALQRYKPNDFITLVEKHKIAYHEKKLGQLFCDKSARQIVTMLTDECNTAHVDIKCQQSITSVSKSDTFCVEGEQGRYTASALVLATGGLSIPQMGASNFSHRIATQFGVPVTAMRPGLVPLTFGHQDQDLAKDLSGVALEVIVQCDKKSFRENLLFTHRGISGPAILQISSCWTESKPLVINWLPDINAKEFLWERKRTRPKAEVKTILSEKIPQNLARYLTDPDYTGSMIGSLTDNELAKLAARLQAWTVVPTGTEGYAKAEVTLGGIDTRALSSKTMQVNNVSGLYVIGEALDVTGWLGGYNFQWAWSSGWSAGDVV